jgi:spermidine synthase
MPNVSSRSDVHLSAGRAPTPTLVHSTEPSAERHALRLACYTGLILFFELAWIRYTSAYVRVFGFYQNFVLIATFLGMGVGLLRARAAPRLKWLAPPATLLLLIAVGMFSVARIAVPKDPNEFLWGIFGDAGTTHSVPLIVVVAILFTLIALFFVPLGALVGERFRKLPPLRAYAADIAGSLAGILAFGALSALRQPPVIWFAVGFVTFVLVSMRDRRYVLSLGVVGASALGLASWTSRVKPEYWSPYYRINVERRDDGGFTLLVNGSLHQIMLPLDSTRAATRSYVGDVYRAYVRPYRYAARLDTALVVGAGTGNDLALLLQNGAKYIDAVEIDPTIADIGGAGHPKLPYADPRVHRHINDARAFLRTTPRHYNVIIFGTLDSQTLLSGMSSVRLDNYVYTVESFRAARSRLAPDGTLIAYHMSANPSIGAKLYQMIGDAFGEPPGVFYEFDYLFNLTFIAGHGAREVPPLGMDLKKYLLAPTTRPHDDWPYLYLTSRTIPAHYIAALATILLIACLFIGVGARRTLLSGKWDTPLFFMGAGFLLVETKSVTEMSLLFGSTWTVNLMVFAAILVMVLIANLIVQRRAPGRTGPLFIGLLAALTIAYAIPASALLPLGTIAQWAAGGVMVALPILFAALIFSTLLSRRRDAGRALAYNLLGAIIGGVLEYSAMALGIKAMYIVAAALYAGAAVSAMREERAALVEPTRQRSTAAAA